MEKHNVKIFVGDCEYVDIEAKGTLQEAIDQAREEIDYWECEGYSQVRAKVDDKDVEEYEVA